MDALTSFKTLALVFISGTLFSFHVHAGYFGAAHNINTSASFDQQDDGFRVDFGSNVTPWLDLEWSYIDYGYSRYDDPTFKEGDPDDIDDNGSFENTGYGEQSVNEQVARFEGLANIRTQGLSAGLKFKKSVNDWMQVYARVSFMAWQAESISMTIFAPRPAFDSDGNETDLDNAANIPDECPNQDLNGCRVVDTDNPKSTWAVDFWYGYGAIFKPLSWLAVRTEYSILTLNAEAFPRGKLEAFSTGLEIHF